MKKLLYDYGEFLQEIGQSFKVLKTGWHLEENLKPATEEQQKELVTLGWGREESLSENGARVMIDAIKEGSAEIAS